MRCVRATMQTSEAQRHVNIVDDDDDDDDDDDVE